MQIRRALVVLWLLFGDMGWAQAQDNIHNVSYQLLAGVTYGGDNIYEVAYTDGSDETIKAGGLLYLGAGLQWRQPRWGLQGSFGYHFDSASASNGDVSFSRWVLEAIPYYRINERSHLGLGVGYHTGVELDADFSFSSNDQADFDDATTFILEYGYRLNGWSNSILGIRYVDVDYDISRVNQINVSRSGTSVSGSHLGAMLYFSF